MATNFVKTNIVLRHDTGQNWETKNPVLLKGEAAVNTDNNLVKIGDGENPWKALSYINDISSAITAENIQTALGYNPVKDVQVAGNSVLVDGIGNIKIGSGLDVDKNGIYVPNTTIGMITGRMNNKALTANAIDNIVKAAMCDGHGTAWTDTEQKAARERMGIDKPYELIEEITLEEETGAIERDTEPDGRAYNFTKLKCLIIGMNSSGSNVFYTLTSNRLNKIPISIFSVSGSNANYRSLAEISCAGAIIVATGTNLPGFNVTQATMLGMYNVSPTICWPSGKIEGFILRPQNTQSTAQLMAGTKIMVYGVRA